MEKVSKFLAENIISLRKTRGHSQGDLAKLANLPRSTVTYLESGSANPSLNNLIKISKSLGVKMEELLSIPHLGVQHFTQDDLKIEKKSQGKVLIQKILTDPIPGMDIDKLELGARSSYKGVTHIKGTKEYFTCISGQITIYVDGEKYDLKSGEVLSFPGDLNHSYNNSSDKKAVGFGVVALAYIL
jgi:transcriptional regulator with XRE-family HTH domain